MPPLLLLPLGGLSVEAVGVDVLICRQAELYLGLGQPGYSLREDYLVAFDLRVPLVFILSNFSVGLLLKHAGNGLILVFLLLGVDVVLHEVECAWECLVLSGDAAFVNLQLRK